MPPVGDVTLGIHGPRGVHSAYDLTTKVWYSLLSSIIGGVTVSAILVFARVWYSTASELVHMRPDGRSTKSKTRPTSQKRGFYVMKRRKSNRGTKKFKEINYLGLKYYYRRADSIQFSRKSCKYSLRYLLRKKVLFWMPERAVKAHKAASPTGGTRDLL